MSFFKIAENLLNNLDQQTQSSINSALTKNDEKKPSKSKSKKLPEINSSSILNSQSTSNLATNSEFYQNSSTKTSTASLRHLFNKPNKEDELINFLNNTDLTELSAPLSQASSRVDLEKNDLEPQSETDNIKFTIGDKSKQSETEDEVERTVNDQESKFLKKEITSLNQEIKSLMKRIQDKDDEFKKTKKKIENYQNQISQSDKIIRELRSREEDLNESIRSKDSQLAIIRVRLDETDNELKARKAEIEILKSESERILNDHSNSSDLQSQVLDSLKDKLTVLENDLQREKEAYATTQREHMALHSRLEHEKQSLVDTLQSIEKKLNEEKSKNNELTSQLKNSKTSMNFLKQEFEEYKLKATKTLQSKDRLIATLKENATGGSNDTENPGLNIKSIEIDELKLERDSLKEDLTSKNTALEILKSELIDLESQTAIEIELLKDQISNFQEQSEDTKQVKENLEQDLRNLRQQLDYTQEELYKQKSNLNGRLQEREAEIDKLRTQLTTKSMGSTTEKELENRLHLLTENLIQKQTLIEALQSEKHSIFLQLERSERRLQDYESIVASKKSTTTIRMHDDDEAISSKIPMLRESPYDHEMTKKVKRAASEIDKFSIRLGVFLKKYPIARIFVIFYMFLLHLWVIIVLFTYKPEVHDPEFHPSAMPHQ
ncbi:unnamed protein product [Brachionus calyciflorus]|uniref:Golgin-84 n=1 Tax=Brachionus calyciflorus TaxID=104777 RepID=A0A813RWB3_9BILA|nr:unnamed protein product [Brachionus calyciflorus]